jgi:hypothetical protein
MEEQTTKVGADSTKVEENPVKIEGQADETQGLEQGEDQNSRLLKESKKYKERAAAAEKELERLKKAALEEQGKYKEMYESTAQKFDHLKKALAKEKIKQAVSVHAAKAGCLNVDALMKLGNAELLTWDEDSMNVDGAQEFVESARREHSYLFGAAKTPSVNGVTPGGITKEKKLTAADIAKMKGEDKAQVWLAAMQKK